MAVSKHEVNLQFTADTSNISKELDKLQSKLKQLSEGQGVIGKMTITKDVNDAMNAAAKLQTILKNSRLDSGKLDIVSFQDNLAKAGLSVEDLSRHFASLGPQGAKAFDQLTQSVMTAENPMRRTSALLSNFATTLKNTAKWQISSSLLHGFMSSISSAYGYAQDLNESLNNIRIVSKQNTDQMADFAKEANKAAKELSVSTTAYTDAALIFYQQGLEGRDVTERTDVVAKMSNVTKDSVDEVSSYMTAIWNNFDDGSESLEHYADVITGLGAATASSSAEIAQGLEKFAAVADTVGLSYDYATASLATVVAQTRQSADTVGTAFKTLFARIEGLQLGKELEDGVDLNKYSQALAKIGVNVLDANGELRKMDDILNDLGAKWKNIDEATQVAVAQTVAGTRQYNQLVALLDNWDKVQENIGVARGSEGELQSQADIYAESWEAAQKRVKAAAQGIYTSLIDEKFFISLDNGLEKVLTAVGKIIDSLGGIKSLWPIIFTAFGKLFGGELNIGFSNIYKNLYGQTKEAINQIEDFRNRISTENFELSIAFDNKSTELFESEYKRIHQEIIQKQSELKTMTAGTSEAAQAEIDSVVARLSNLKEYLEYLLQKESELKGQITSNMNELPNKFVTGQQETSNSTKQVPAQQPAQQPTFDNSYYDANGQLKDLEGTVSNVDSLLEDLNQDFRTMSDGLVQLFAKMQTGMEEGTLSIEDAKNMITGMEDLVSKISGQNLTFIDPADYQTIEQLFNDIRSGSKTAEQSVKKLTKLFSELLSEAKQFSTEDIRALEKINPHMKKFLENLQESVNQLGKVNASIEETSQEVKNLSVNSNNNNNNNNNNNKPDKPIVPNVNLSQAVMQAGQFAMTLTQVNNIIEQINDKSKSTSEKFLSIVTSISMMGFSLKGSLGFIGNILTGIGNITNKVAEKLAFDTADLAVEKLNTAENKKQSAIQSEINAKKEQEVVTDTIDAGIEGAKTKTGGKVAGKLGSFGTKLSGLGTGAVAGGETAGAGLTGAGVVAAGVVGTVLVAVLAAAVIAKIVHEVAKSNAAKQAAILAANQDKKQEKVKQTTEKAETTASAQEDFHKLFKAETTSLDELRNSALNAAKATDDQTIAVLALKGSFQQLDDYLTDKVLKDQEAELKALNKANQSSEATIQAGLISAARDEGAAVDEWGKTFDIYGLNHVDKEGDNSDDLLYALLSKVTNKEFDWGQVQTSDLTKVLMGQSANGMTSDEFLTELRNIVNMGGAGAKGAQQILDWASSDKVKTYLEDYQKNLDQIQKIGLENAFTKALVGKKEITSIEEYYDILRKIKDIAKENGVDINVEGFDEKLNSIALSYAELQDQALNAQSALAIVQELQPELFTEENREKSEAQVNALIEHLADQINAFNNSKKNYILLYPKFVADNFVDENGNINLDEVTGLIDYQAQSGEYETLRGITDNFDVKKSFSEEDLAQLADYNINTAGDPLDIYNRLIERESELQTVLSKTYESAHNLSEEIVNQHNKLKSDEMDIDASNVQSAEAARNAFVGIDASGENAETTSEQLNNQINDYIINYAKTVIGEDGKAIKEWDETEESEKLREFMTGRGEIREQTETGSDKFYEGLTESVKSYVEELQQQGKTEKEILEITNKISPMYSQMAKQVMKTTNRVNDFSDSLEETTKATAVTEAEQKELKQTLRDDQVQLELTSNYLDKLQAAYKTLYSAMEEYNETGAMSLDTVQALIDAGPGYVRYLLDENGQLQLNEESIKNATMAKYDYMEAQQAKIMLDQLEVLTTYGVNSAEWDQVAASYADAAALAAAGNTMDAVAAKARSMAKEFSGASAELLNMASAADAFKQVFNAGRTGAATNFSRFMGVSPKKGSGGKGKEKETKELKEYADEFDRFYPYQKVIDDVADAMSDLAKAQDHMAGGELVGALRKQNKLLEQQKKAYQDLAKEQKAYQKEMQADLAKYGMSFNVASGNIVNYAEATQAMLDQYNAAIEKYNKSAQEDADKKALEAVEKDYEKFKKLVSNYQNILTEIQDTENNLDDIYYEQIANNLKEFEIMVEVNLDIKEAERAVNDFLNKINKNFKTLRKSTEEWMSIFDHALKQAHTYVDGEYSTISVDLDALNKVKSAIDSGDYGHEGAMFASETEAIMKYKELSEQLKDDAEDLYDLYTDAWSEYLDAVDEAMEMWEEVLDNFDTIADTLDHYEKLIELLHGTDSDESLQLLSELYQKQVDLSIAKQAILRKEIDTLEQEYQQLIANGASENDEDVKKIKEAIKNANKELEDTIEDYIDTIQKELENSIKIANNTRQKSIWGNEIDKIKEDWELAKKASDGYYDSVQKIYQIDKLNDGYKKLINDTKSLKTKKLLAEFQQKEIDNLQKINKLTEHDVEIAQKQLELKQAEIALQEAQDNKSIMRLQRDAQGNWSYQFVADEQNVEDKFQAIEDKANELRDLTIKATQEATEAAMDFEIEFYNKVTELAIKYKDDKVAFEQEYNKLVEEYYGEEGLITLKIAESERYKRATNKATMELLFALYKDDVTNYDKMTEDEKALIDDLKTKDINSFDDMLKHNIDTYDQNDAKANEVNQNIIKYWQTMAAEAMSNMTNITEHTNQCYDDIIAALNRYNDEVQRSEEASGLAWSNIEEAVRRVGDAIDEVTSQVQECVDASTALEEFRSRVEAIGAAWDSVRSSIEAALQEQNRYLEKLREIKEEEAAMKSMATDIGSHEIDLGKSSSGGDDSDGASGSSYGDDDNIKTQINHEIVDVYDLTHDSHYKWSGIPVSDTGNRGNGRLSVTVSSPGEDEESVRARWLRTYGGRPVSYDTGGYTGVWNNENSNGRLAILHQKELILNSDDTQNILDAVDLVRQINAGSSLGISETISNTAMEMASALQDSIDYLSNSMTSYISRIVDAIAFGHESSQLEQNVHIDASFPNATDRYEIESAFNNLVNIASQYTGRR